MDHRLMFLALAYLAESGPARSGEFAESFGIGPKHASMVLLRCKRRGFVWRRPYRRGRVRGYMYGLADKGAKWLLYKVSRKEKDVQYSRRPTRSVHPPRSETLGLSQNRQSRKGFGITDVGALMSAMQSQNPATQTADTWTQFFPIILLEERTSERDFAYYLYQREHQEKLELLQKIQHEKTTRLHAQKEERVHESFARGLTQGREIGFKYGMKLGIEIGGFDQVVRTQAKLNEVLLKKNWKSARERNKI